MVWKLSIKQGEKLVQEHDLTEQGLNIGRSANCQVQIDNKRVSGQHARVYIENGACYVQDLDSTNGTYLNGRLIQREPLMPADQVEVAGYHLEVYEVAEPTESVAAPGIAERTQYHSAAAVEEAVMGGLMPVAKKNPKAETPLRQGETGADTVPFRVGRYFSVNGEWFFSTREGQDMGPFLTLDAAKAAFTEYGQQLGFGKSFTDTYSNN